MVSYSSSSLALCSGEYVCGVDAVCIEKRIAKAKEGADPNAAKDEAAAGEMPPPPPPTQAAGEDGMEVVRLFSLVPYPICTSPSPTLSVLRKDTDVIYDRTANIPKELKTHILLPSDIG
jgi:hypothetical protein